MSRITKCTSCDRQVTIPEGVEPFESVRCPLCEAEYALVAVLFQAEPGDDASEPPPQLVPVAAGSLPDQPKAEEEAADEAPADEEPEEAAIDSTVEGAPEADSSEEAPTGLEPDEPAPETEPPDPDEVPSGDDAEQPEEEIEAAEAEEQSEEVAVEAEAPTEEDQPAEEAAAAEDETAEGKESAEGEEADEEESAEGEEAAEGEETPQEEDETTEEEDATEASAAETPPEADQEKAVAVRCPHCEAEYPLSEAIVVETGDALGPGAAAAAARAVFGEADGSPAPALDVWAKAAGLPQIDVGDGLGPQAVAADAAAFDFATEEAETEPGAEGKPRPRRRTNQKSGVRTLVGIVLGGLGGVLIAYYLLNWIRPEGGNFLQIPLPGIPHTYKYSPDWFPGFLKPAPESEEALKALEGLKGALEDALAEFEQPEAPPEFKTEGRAPDRIAEPPSNDIDLTRSSAFGGAVPEPEREPSPKPKRKTLPEGDVGLRAPPSYSADELGEALKAASEGMESTPGEISQEAYQKICRLAEVMTFVDSKPGARAAGSRRSAVRKLVEQMGEDPGNRDKIGYQAGALCLDQDRQRNGILLAGRVAKLISEGEAHGAHVELAASGKLVLVVSKRPLPVKADDAVVILGSIVDDPAENLVGFPTEQRFVIWAGLTVKVEE